MIRRRFSISEKRTSTFEANGLEDRRNGDVEMMRELGYCSGIENYSRYFGRQTASGPRPFCLIDYFPDDFLLVIEEKPCDHAADQGHVR
ncbi:MAG: hypothetical protein MZU84_01070 [Sphingobacterium sp.]|nr:hypothetical protein [Sphingobacterium sp.]